MYMKVICFVLLDFALVTNANPTTLKICKNNFDSNQLDKIREKFLNVETVYEDIKCTINSTMKIPYQKFSEFSSQNQSEYEEYSNFCSESFSESEITIRYCPKVTIKIPKCCPFDHMVQNDHPEICKITGVKIQNDENFVYLGHDLECIRQGKMFSSRIIDSVNISQVSQEFQDKNEPFCIDQIESESESESKKIFWQVSYCTTVDWPYQKFSIQIIERYIFGFCSLISIISLIVSNGVYFLVRKKHNLTGYLQFCFMINMLLESSLILFGSTLVSNPHTFCDTFQTIFITVYLMTGLSNMAWLSILSVDILNSFWRLKNPIEASRRSRIMKKLFMYITIGWGFPISIVILCIILSKTLWPTKYCYYFPQHILHLAVPIFPLTSITCFLTTFILILKYQKDSKFASENTSKKNESKKLIKLFLKLFVLTGITWNGIIIEIASGSSNKVSWPLMIFRVIICLDGLWIFLLYICNKKVVKNLKSEAPSVFKFFKLEKYLEKKPPSSSTMSTTTTTNISNSSFKSNDMNMTSENL